MGRGSRLTAAGGVVSVAKEWARGAPWKMSRRSGGRGSQEAVAKGVQRGVRARTKAQIGSDESQCRKVEGGGGTVSGRYCGPSSLRSPPNGHVWHPQVTRSRPRPNFCIVGCRVGLSGVTAVVVTRPPDKTTFLWSRVRERGTCKRPTSPKLRSVILTNLITAVVLHAGRCIRSTIWVD